ncbi:ABC transporter substrate-binding protein [Azoarcus taiwanensis]|uniref:ABC transporter substrate-binding protein n=1 Tax=Azoarcus taiwanensis TaxID=666964 RepID=A0A972F980_9RHOO|nr:ABC transporter substrate-binding protein [Azoarcus taiwanensis]NMG04130.1 ABC transporter substrate-binding protein [Azoarcus taiwanensis]
MKHRLLRAALITTLLIPAFTVKADAEIVIGQVAPFTGPLAPTGEHMRAGAQLHFDEVNAAGGIQGRNLKLVIRDDGYVVDDTVRLARELIAEEQPVALFGIVGTGNIAALVREGVLQEADIAAVGLRTGAGSLVKPPHPNLFLGRASYAAEVERMIEQMTTMGMNRIGVFYQDDAFGKDGLDAAEAAMTALGLELTARGAYPRNTTDVEEAARRLAKANPQGVIMVSNTAASAAFVSAFRQLGGDGMLMILSTTDGPQLAARIGNDLARGIGIAQIVPHPNSRAFPIVREFHRAIDAHGLPEGIEANFTLLQGYVGARILVEGLRRAGPDVGPGEFRRSLQRIRNHDLGGLTLNITPDSHTGVDFVDITVIDRNGQLLR